MRLHFAEGKVALERLIHNQTIPIPGGCAFDVLVVSGALLKITSEVDLSTASSSTGYVRCSVERDGDTIGPVFIEVVP